MKVTWEEVRALEDFLQRCEDGAETEYVHDGETWPMACLASCPHLVMTMGFDEYVAFDGHQAFQKYWFAGDVEPTAQSIYRTPSGQWLLLWGASDSLNGDITFHSKTTIEYDDRYAKSIGWSELFMRLYDVADRWVDEPKTIWHPKLWTPSAQEREASLLGKGVHQILAAIRDEKKALSDLSWRQLEELVAEILRSNGLEIHLVRETPQGGRDIIARGELIPGQEPVAMAVEVKHKEVVDRPEVEMALWQNRHFPALLFVTSGRFTSGVLQEKALPENRLRLFLKDGVALGDMIRDYGHATAPRSRGKDDA